MKKAHFGIFFVAIFLALIVSLYFEKPKNSGAATPLQQILEYKLDEGSGMVANDTSGSGNNGTLNGPPTWETGKFGSSLQFRNLNSPEDYVNGGSATSLDNLPQGDFSIENWVKFPVAPIKGSYFGIMNKIGTAGGENGWWLNVNWYAGNIWELYYYGRMLNGTKANSTANVAIQNDKWHHIAMVYSATTKKAKLYFDGSEVTYTRQGAGTGAPADDAAGNLIVGRYRTTNFPHRLDDLHIYNYARTAEQIAYDANVVNVKEFGARGDGVAEDQVAFQTAIDYLKTKGGGRLYVPTGTYILHKTTGPWNGTFNIIGASNIEMYGDGATLSTLKRKDVTPIGDTHIVRVINSNGIKFHDLGFDGSRATANQDQMHGVYILNSSNILLENLKLTRMRGSATYLIGDNEIFCTTTPCFTDHVTVKNSSFVDNYRAGDANQGGLKFITYQNNTYDGTVAGQDIDFEPTGQRPGAEDVIVTGNNSTNNGGSIALTLGGTSDTLRAKRFTVTNNNLSNKGVQITNMDTLTLSGNTINSGSQRAMNIIRNSNNLNIANNSITSGFEEVIHLTGNNLDHITFDGNTLYPTTANTRAIHSEGLGNHIYVLNNNVVGPQGGLGSNVYAVFLRNVFDDGVTRVDFNVSGNKFWRAPAQILFKTPSVNSKFQDVTASDNIYYYDGGGNFTIGYEPTDPATWIINLVSTNNTVQPEIPSP